jgi:hypothetical protein
MRDVDEGVLVEDRVLGQHPVERSAELRGELDTKTTADPMREYRRADPVTYRHPAHALAHLDDLARSVRDRDNIGLDRQRVPAPQDHQLPEAQ